MNEFKLFKKVTPPIPEHLEVLESLPETAFDYLPTILKYQQEPLQLTEEGVFTEDSKAILLRNLKDVAELFSAPLSSDQVLAEQLEHWREDNLLFILSRAEADSTNPPILFQKNLFEIPLHEAVVVLTGAENALAHASVQLDQAWHASKFSFKQLSAEEMNVMEAHIAEVLPSLTQIRQSITAAHTYEDTKQLFKLMKEYNWERLNDVLGELNQPEFRAETYQKGLQRG